MHLLPLVVAACSQPPATTAPATVAPATTSATAAANAATLAATSPTGPKALEDERDFSVPKERFTDGERNFDEARKALLERYYDPSVTEDDLYRAALAGMLERADPKMRLWNKLLSPSAVAELRSDLKGELVGVGIGVELDAATGYIDVKRTYPGTPAERAGVAPPDKIVTVDGKLYKGLTLHDVVADIRGKAGETVTLTILRGDKLVSVPLVRARVVFDQVIHMMCTPAVGLVQIPGFNEKTPQALREALADLATQGSKALVVDLRQSPGGSFDDAVAAVGEMVPAGSTVATLRKRGKAEPVVPKTTPVIADEPLAVLVDGSTASSSELVAAALQELRHAILVGSHTKGKWTVQKLEDLPNGYAIKYTVGAFASPDGKSYEGAGMAPDVEVDQTDEATERGQLEADPSKRVAQDVQLRTALRVLSVR
jgi:carboxyl-terminal processing protease